MIVNVFHTKYICNVLLFSSLCRKNILSRISLGTASCSSFPPWLSDNRQVNYVKTSKTDVQSCFKISAWFISLRIYCHRTCKVSQEKWAIANQIKAGKCICGNSAFAVCLLKNYRETEQKVLFNLCENDSIVGENVFKWKCLEIGAEILLILSRYIKIHS